MTPPAASGRRSARAARIAELETPLGRWRLAVTARGLALLELTPGPLAESRERHRLEPVDALSGADLDTPMRQLEEYARGERTRFELGLDLSAGTPFEASVWEAAAAIPYGRVVSYGELAERVGRPLGARAVGRALGRNPVPIVVPCHRVIAGDGSLGGFSGGLDLKQRLLAHEGYLMRFA